MPKIKHGKFTSLCIRCLSTYDDTLLLLKGDKWQLEKMNRAYDMIQKLSDESALLTKMKNRYESRVSRHLAMEVLEKFLLSSIENILSSLNFTPNNWPNERYLVFTVEGLCLFYLRILKKLKECTVSYVPSPEPKTNPLHSLLAKKHRKSLTIARAGY